MLRRELCCIACYLHIALTRRSLSRPVLSSAGDHLISFPSRPWCRFWWRVEAEAGERQVRPYLLLGKVASCCAPLDTDKQRITVHTTRVSISRTMEAMIRCCWPCWMGRRAVSLLLE